MNNAEIVARSRAAVWHPCTQMKSHVMLAGFTQEPVVELSERLAKLAPGKLGHVFFASDGASATEIALKMAVHYWANRGRREKHRYIALEGGYHGETIGALSVTDVALFREAYEPLLHANLLAPFPSVADPDAALDALEKLLIQHGRELAAMIVEPLVQGASGMRMYPASFLKRARELCAHREVLFIADEIMTGFGRTGTMFACEQAGIAPDLMCLSKGITGGCLPLSCVLSTDAIYEAFYDDDVARGFLHSHSYSGNALACRAACAVLDIFSRERVIDANRERAARFSESALPLAQHRSVRNFRNLGMIWAFEVDAPEPEFPRKAFEFALTQGVLLRPIGNTVYFMPPYVISEGEFAKLVETGLAIAQRFGQAA